MTCLANQAKNWESYGVEPKQTATVGLNVAHVAGALLGVGGVFE
jgi:hypothetical protein